ncbi:MAG: flagellar basal body rod protein FlgC [Ignavibacteriales bacterium]|nr:flagellar basal body rod protein FlgC [Ignavibacteriales bacterium]
MRVNLNFGGFKISAGGMGVQRKKMDLIAENIANIDTTKTDKGIPYQRKYLRVTNDKGEIITSAPNSTLAMRQSDGQHLINPSFASTITVTEPKMEMKELIDDKPGAMVYMPDHPDASKDGYVSMPNVNVITEMVDMIAATRGYEANVTAFNASKDIAKNSLEI